MEMSAVLEKLFAMVRDEDKQHLVTQTELLNRLDDAPELGIHRADRAVVPVVVLLQDIHGIDPKPIERFRSRLTSRRSVDANETRKRLLQLAESLVVSLPCVGVAPIGIVWTMRLKRRMRIGHMDVDEERNVTMQLQPRQ